MGVAGCCAETVHRLIFKLPLYQTGGVVIFNRLTLPFSGIDECLPYDPIIGNLTEFIRSGGSIDNDNEGAKFGKQETREVFR